MKRLSLLAVLFFVVVSAFAGDNFVGLTRKRHKDMFDDGVFLHFGLAYPYQHYPRYGMVNLGIQPSFEFGSHFIFSKKNNLAIGATFSWAMAGVSIRGSEDDEVEGVDLSFSLIRFGPLMSVKLDDKIAFDLFFNASPTGRVNWISLYSESYTDFLYGVLWVPGFKFRFDQFTLGGEVQFGKLFVDGREPGDEYYKTNYFNPRVFIGFKL